MLKRIASLLIIITLLLIVSSYSLAEGDFEEGDGWEYRDGILTIIADGGLVDFLENEPDQDQVKEYKHFGYDVSELVIGKNVNEFRMFQFTEEFYPRQITVEKGNLNFIVTDGWLIDTRTGTLVCPSDFEAFQTIQLVNDIPDCVRYVGEYAFYPHNYLKEIFIPESVIGLEKFSLAGCEALKIVDLPTHLETINAGAFLGCTTLDEIQLGEQVKFIGEFAFEGCYYLEQLNMIDTKITTLSNSVFCNCTELRSIILPETLETIESDAFKYCSSLESVVISSEDVAIMSKAFSGCDELKSIVFIKGRPQLLSVGLFAEVVLTPDRKGYYSTSIVNSGEIIPYPTLYYTEAFAAEWAPNGETEWNGYPIQQISQAELDAVLAQARGEEVPAATPAPTAVASPTVAPDAVDPSPAQEASLLDGWMIAAIAAVVIAAGVVVVGAVKRGRK